MDFANLLPPYSSTVWKAIVWAVGGLILLGVILFALDRGYTAYRSAKIDKLKANVAAAVENLEKVKAEGQANTQQNKIAEAVAMQQVKQAASELVEASTATDEAKLVANQALSNLEAQKASNRPTNTTEQDLIDRLNKLEQ